MNVRALRVAGFLLVLSACSSDREKPDTPLDGDRDGSAGDAQVNGEDGSTPAKDGGKRDGGANVDDGGSGSEDGSVVAGCQTTCALGQRCELTGGAYLCKDNACTDLSCTGLEECAQAPAGGHYCKSIACSSDVQCSADRHCDGTKCVADVCEPGAQHCSGSEVIQCASNGGAESARFSCAHNAYFESTCTEASATAASCGCEDDWDCPSFTACIAGVCQGTGVAPTCTLPPEPFDQVLPTLEFRWGGATKASPAADATSPFPSHAQVSMTPVVANLDDDNGDGFINELDFPEIVFISYSTNIHGNGVVRALHGGGATRGKHYFARCGTKRWLEGDDLANAATCTDAEAVLRSGSGVAVADLDADGVPEIVVVSEEGKLQILDNKGALIRESTKQFTALSENISNWRYPQTAVANLDNKGFAELIVGNRVFQLKKNAGDGKIDFGTVLTGTAAEGAQGDSDKEFGPLVCPANLIDADPADDDVSQEIVVGTVLYALPTPPVGVATRADCPQGNSSDFCTDKLTVVWNARTVNGTTNVPNIEAFCAVADVLGADTASAPGPTNKLDQVPEVILTSNGRLLILNARTGALLRKIDVEAGQRGGAPNIDDFDNDGFPEIAFASSGFYTVIDLQTANATYCPSWPNSLDRAGTDAPGTNTARNPGGSCTADSECNPGAICASGTCTCLHNGWRRVTEDDSSKVTSSSVFDFNGDGAAEVVYGDECYFRVYDGASGNVHLAIPSASRTVLENPVIADVDNDGNAEIVFVNNNETIQCNQTTLPLVYPDGVTTVQPSELPNGIQVWGDAKDTWVSARRIWNQHAYHVTNVTEGGQVPRKEPESWRPYGNRLYNTYRSQPRSAGVAPDLALTAIQISSPDVACGQLSNMLDISVLVQNLGDLRVGPGVKVKFYGELGGTLTALLDANDQPIVHTLSTSLEPGSSLLASVSYVADGAVPTRVVARIDEDQAERECRENNNEVSGEVSAGAALADLHLDLLSSSGTCAAKVVKVRVQNDGALAASNLLVRLYAGNPSAGGLMLVEQVLAGPIAPGESVEADIALGAVNRDITVWGIVDPQDAIPECNDVNNVDKGDDLACADVVI